MEICRRLKAISNMAAKIEWSRSLFHGDDYADLDNDGTFIFILVGFRAAYSATAPVGLVGEQGHS
jgi:hypothetical protein